MFALPRTQMVVEIHNRKKPEKSAVDLAIAAVEGNPNPLDMDMGGIDPDPTSLDLTLPGKPDNRHAAGPGHAGRRAKKASGVPAQRNQLTEVLK